MTRKSCYNWWTPFELVCYKLLSCFGFNVTAMAMLLFIGRCLWVCACVLTSLATVCQCRWLSHWSIRSWCRNLHLSGTSRASLTNSPTAEERQKTYNIHFTFRWGFLINAISNGCYGNPCTKCTECASGPEYPEVMGLTEAAVRHHDACVTPTRLASLLAPILDADWLICLHYIGDL